MKSIKKLDFMVCYRCSNVTGLSDLLRRKWMNKTTLKILSAIGECIEP